MEVVYGLTFFGCLMSMVALYYRLDYYKTKHQHLLNLNQKMNEELDSIKSKHSSLWHQLQQLSSISDEQKRQLEEFISKQETFEFLVGSKISWLDKSNEVEYGIVYDDFIAQDNHYVVVRRIKNQKLTGGPISINAKKVNVVK
jgi:hypothetical protein